MELVDNNKLQLHKGKHGSYGLKSVNGSSSLENESALGVI